MTRPVCECHGEPMRRNTDKRYMGGFYWRCAIRDRMQSASYKKRRYETDPLWRLHRNLKSRLDQNKKRRRDRTPARPEIAAFLVSVKARRTHGEVSPEG